MLKFRRTAKVAVTLMAAASMLVPADAQAFFGCFQKRQNAAAALYGGTVCNPCGQQLVCNYVPQTCYRTQTVAVPVTTMKPVCGADPCTGCPTTVMRPVVTYQQQVQYVPYQSYRLQYSVAQPACPTATTSYYAPTLSSGVAAPATTYAAPTTTFAAPASGCSSCNSGVAATSYYAPSTSTPITTNYAPVPTTRMLTPGVVVPGAAAYAAPSSTGVYNYPTTQGNVSVGGYSYATPGASGVTPPSMYGGTSSFTPAAAAPSSGPGYATSNYGAPTLAIPSYSGSSVYSTPAPTSSGVTTTVPSLGGSTYSGSTYGGSTYSGSTLNGTTMSSAAPLSSSAVSGSVINQQLRLGPTSTPALVDPDDKTASTWRPQRAWNYQPVGNVVPATYTRTIEDSSNVVPATATVPTMPTTFAHAQPIPVPATSAPSTTARLGAPRPAMEIEVMYAPQPQAAAYQPTQPAVDRDGWRSSSR